MTSFPERTDRHMLTFLFILDWPCREGMAGHAGHHQSLGGDLHRLRDRGKDVGPGAAGEGLRLHHRIDTHANSKRRQVGRESG